jgi:hypothetical protein
VSVAQTRAARRRLIQAYKPKGKLAEELALKQLVKGRKFAKGK